MPSENEKVPSSVTVAVRARPLAEGETGCLVIAERSVSVSKVKNEQEQRVFAFDFAYDGSAKQSDLWNELGQPILLKAMEGFNGTIFAYGQTGSGKTHTMLGSGVQAVGDDAGIIPRLGEELFFHVDRCISEGPTRKFLLTCSFLEIYIEVCSPCQLPDWHAVFTRSHPLAGAC